MKDENIFLAEQLKTEIRKADNIKVSFFIMVPSFPMPDSYIKAVTKNRLKYKLILYFIFRADYAIEIMTIMLEIIYANFVIFLKANLTSVY